MRFATFLAIGISACSSGAHSDDGWMDGDDWECSSDPRAEGCTCSADANCDEGLVCLDHFCVSDGECGNGVIEAREECDNGAANADEAVCETDCVLQACGDGSRGVDEGCDDGNLDPGDGCEPDCTPSAATGWDRTAHIEYGSLDGVDVASDAGGNVFVTGWAAMTQVWTRSYDAWGAERWTDPSLQGQLVGGQGVETDAEGNVYVVGSTGFANMGTSDVWLRKYDTDGGEIWTRTFDGGGELLSSDGGEDVTVTAEGHPIVVGAIAVGDALDMWIREYDADGNEVFTRTFDGGGFDIARGVSASPGGGFFVVGDFESAGQQDVWVRKYDDLGEEIWTRTYDASGATDWGLSVAADDSGGAVVLANASEGLWMRKLDAAGDEVWTVVDSSIEGRRVAIGPEGRIAVGATSPAGAIVVRLYYEADGAELATQTIEGGHGAGVAFAPDGFVLATGALTFGDPDTDEGTWSDLWVAKLDL